MQNMRSHKVVKLNYTEMGWKRLKIKEYEDGSISPNGKKDKQLRAEVIEGYKKDVKGNDDPEFFEVAIVPPSQDFIVRNMKRLVPLITIDSNDREATLRRKYLPIFYENYDTVSEVVCMCVRDPNNLNRRLIVPDSTPDDMIDPDQIRIGEWNIRVSAALIEEQGYYVPMNTPTPTATVFWAAFMMTSSIIVIPKKGKTPEPDVMEENIDSFPEDSDELAEGVEDPLLEGSSELSDGSDRSGKDDTGCAAGQDRHPGVRTAPEGDQGSSEKESGSEEVS